MERTGSYTTSRFKDFTASGISYAIIGIMATTLIHFSRFFGSSGDCDVDSFRQGAWCDVYWKALVWNIAHLPETLQARKTIQATRTVSDRGIRKYIMKGNAKLHMFFRVGVPKVS